MNPEEGGLRPQLIDRIALNVPIHGLKSVEDRIEFREETVTELASQVAEVGIEEKIKRETPLVPKKERSFKRKSLKMEGEKLPRVKKSGKKLIEEKIEIEELEQEALSAVKEKERKGAEEEREELRGKEKKEEFPDVDIGIDIFSQH
jgi:hypothetical protein